MPQGLGAAHLITSEIRFADFDDVPRILVLAEMAWIGSPHYADKAADYDRWEDIVTACVTRGCVIVCEVDGIVSGVIVGCEEEDYGTGETAVIDLLTYVIPKARRAVPGLAADMIALMEAWGIERGLDWCRLGSRSGYRARAVVGWLEGLGYDRMDFVDCWKRLQ